MTETLELRTVNNYSSERLIYAHGLVTGLLVGAGIGFILGCGYIASNIKKGIEDKYQRTEQVYSEPKVTNFGNGIIMTYFQNQDQRRLEINYSSGKEFWAIDLKPFGDVDYIHESGDGEYERGTKGKKLSFIVADTLMEEASK